MHKNNEKSHKKKNKTPTIAIIGSGRNRIKTTLAEVIKNKDLRINIWLANIE